MTDTSFRVPIDFDERPTEARTDEQVREPITAFPLDALPETIGRFISECSESLPAAPELIAIPALVVVAAAIGNARAIALKEGWSEPCSLFAAVVSPSGAMKSPALQKAAKPLQDLDSQTRRTWTADVTVEQLARLLAANPRGLLQVRDELSAWVKSMNQYKQRGADREFYLSVWGGVPAKVDRVGDGTPTSITIPHPALSVVGCIPPDVLPNLEDDKGLEDGFLPRLLFSWPQPLPVRWSNRVVSEGVRDHYARLIQQLFALPYGGEPVFLSLTTAASARFIQWHDGHCAEMEQPGLPSFLQAAYAKLKGYCARLALIHALAVHPQTDIVDLESVEAAIKMVSYFKAQAWNVMPLIRIGTINEVERCKAEIRRKLSGGGVIKRDLQKRSAFDAEVFKQALHELSYPELVTDSKGVLRLWAPTTDKVV